MSFHDGIFSLLLNNPTVEARAAGHMYLAADFKARYSAILEFCILDF